MLLLDANIVIKLMEDGIWGEVVTRCDVHVARTVVAEAQHSIDEEGFAIEIDLRADERSKRITVFEVQAGVAQAFKAQFKPGFFTRLDPGELESLVFLFAQKEGWLISSADKVVFRVLGSCGRGDQGISLEEILRSVGLGRSVSYQFTRDFRESWSRRGFAEALNGETFLPSCSADTCATIARQAIVVAPQPSMATAGGVAREPSRTGPEAFPGAR